MPATSIGPSSHVRAIQISVDGSSASYITDCSRFWKAEDISLDPPAARYAPARAASPVTPPSAVIIEAMSSDAQILGALLARSNSIICEANMPWAKISRYSMPVFIPATLWVFQRMLT